MSRQAFDELLRPLRDLQAILRDEKVALRDLDFAGIDAATLAKEDLAGRMEQAGTLTAIELSPPQRAELRALRDDVGELARHNHLRLRATLHSVQGMVGAMTGSTPATYGRNARPSGPSAQAILTTEVG